MAKKRKITRPARPLSKRQYSHWQQLRRRQSVVFFVGTLVIVAVVAVLGVGWFISSYRPMHQVVVRVNDAEFNMQYFIRMLKLQAQGQSSDLVRLIAQNLPRSIEQNELVRQAAVQLGVTVGDDEISKALKDAKQPNDQVHRDLTRTQLLVTKLKSDYFDKQVPTEAAQVNMQAMLLESEGQANDIRARVDKSESFSDIAKSSSLDNYTKTSSGNVSWHTQDALKQLLGSAVPGDYAFGSPAGTLSQPRYDADVSKQVGYWLIKVNQKDTPDQADISAIMVGSLDEARSVRARLVAGEDFSTVAKEVSQLSGAKDNGGNLGVMSRNNLTPAADEFVFKSDTKAGTLSDPIRDTSASTKGGYWLVNVLDKADSRKIEDSDRSILKDQALNQWAGTLWTDPNYKVEDFMDQTKLNYAILQLPRV